MGIWHQLAMEPPFRLFIRAWLKRANVSAQIRALWELSQRPAYLLGVLTGVEQALKEDVREISVIEFGVAGGNGLVALQTEAEAVERELGVAIKVYGFDMGQSGLPELIHDYRDHPDGWRAGDFPMHEPSLRARLAARTTLILGNVSETVREFFSRYQAPPLGFVSFDLDLYSSTRSALEIFAQPNTRMLKHTPVYFDDIEFLFNHHRAGELLALSEFNQQNANIVIDRWHGVKSGRPFPESPFLDKMYVAHDLEAISKAELKRESLLLPLKVSHPS